MSSIPVRLIAKSGTLVTSHGTFENNGLAKLWLEKLWEAGHFAIVPDTSNETLLEEVKIRFLLPAFRLTEHAYTK